MKVLSEDEYIKINYRVWRHHREMKQDDMKQRVGEEKPS
jgi:hypothetical protein